MRCSHRLCEIIGGACSLATHRSRGCRPGLWPRTVAPEVFDEVRALVAVVEVERAAAVRLAQIVRREASEDRPLLAHARSDEPELADALARLIARRG